MQPASSTEATRWERSAPSAVRVVAVSCCSAASLSSTNHQQNRVLTLQGAGALPGRFRMPLLRQQVASLETDSSQFPPDLQSSAPLSLLPQSVSRFENQEGPTVPALPGQVEQGLASKQRLLATEDPCCV